MHSTLDLHVLLVGTEDRELRLRGTHLLLTESNTTRRPVRRWVGRQLVRAGTRLAAEQTMRPARAR